jgi:hypothetical protein
VEIGGYELSARLAGDLEALTRPASLPRQLGETHWMEVVRDANMSIPAAASELVEATRTAGTSIEAHVFVGEPFWAATEIVENLAIVHATTGIFSAARAA